MSSRYSHSSPSLRATQPREGVIRMVGTGPALGAGPITAAGFARPAGSWRSRSRIRVGCFRFPALDVDRQQLLDRDRRRRHAVGMIAVPVAGGGRHGIQGPIALIVVVVAADIPD